MEGHAAKDVVVRAVACPSTLQSCAASAASHRPILRSLHAVVRVSPQSPLLLGSQPSLSCIMLFTLCWTRSFLLLNESRLLHAILLLGGHRSETGAGMIRDD